jgi:hypothetical protein
MIKSRYELARKKLRTLAIQACLAGRFDQDSVFMVTSSPRSGSTLLTQVLAAIPNSCVLFEPLQLKEVPEAKAAQFTWRTYVDPDQAWCEGKAFLKRVFEGRVINEWTTKEMSFGAAYKATRMIVKFVRANRLLPWICRTFELPSPILLIRHPCAVIASQLNYGWGNAERPELPSYLASFPSFQSALAQVTGVEEYLAASWALDQLPPLLQPPPHPWTLITYEELLIHPEQTLAKIFQSWNLDVDIDLALSKLSKPSRVVSKSGISGINGWKKQLTNQQIERILSTVNSFGLTFYSQQDEADYGILNNEQITESIRNAGNTQS